MVIPIADRHLAYAEPVAARAARTPACASRWTTARERMQAKIRDAQLQKVPYMLVVGDKEAAAGAVSVRLRTNENLGAVPLADFLAVASRSTPPGARTSGPHTSSPPRPPFANQTPLPAPGRGRGRGSARPPRLSPSSVSSDSS